MHAFNGPLSGSTQVSHYQKGKTNLDFTEARDSEWHQRGRIQVFTSLQTDNYASTPTHFLQVGCPSCRSSNSAEALKAVADDTGLSEIICNEDIIRCITADVCAPCKVES